ncbi:MAG: PAS domain S-box protein [Candidatus Levyibacteriota bacterium]
MKQKKIIKETSITKSKQHLPVIDKHKKIAGEQVNKDELNRILVDNIPNLAWMANADGYIYWYNKRWYEYTGTKPKEMEGWGWQSVHDSHELPKVLKRWKESIKARKSFEMVFPIKGKDGVFRPFLTRVVPIKDKNKQVIHWLGTNTDITEQKKIEENLQKNQAHLKFLAEASRLLFSSVDHIKTLQNITDLIIPHFADYTRIVVVDNKKHIKEIAINHVDPKKIPLVKELYETYVNENRTHGIHKLLTTGMSEIIPEMSPEVYKSVEDNPRLAVILKALHLTSYMGVPMKARGKTIGAIIFSSTHPTKRYSQEDLAFAEELANRAALAIDNANLFEEVQEELKERRRAERAFKESESRKTAFFETALDAIITINAKGQIIEFNPAAERMFGYPHKKAIGLEMASLIVPSGLRSAHRNGLSHYLKTGNEKILNKRIEIIAQHKDGELFPVELTITRVPNTAEVLFTGTIQDITKRKENENKLFASEERLRLALEAGQIGVWDWNIAQNTLVWSDRVYEFYGATRENFEVNYDNFSKYIFPEDKQRADNAIRKVLEGKEEYNIVYRILTLLGEIRWIASRAIVTRDKDGKPLRMLGATSDVTEQKKVEQDKNDFVSIATHELKTPVTSIKAYAQVLQRKFQRAGDEHSAGQLDKMNAQLDKLTSLISDLLDATKIESGQLQMHQETFDFDKLVLEITEELQRTTEKHVITINGKSKQKITADRERTGQVLTNLISNAIKYSPHTEKIIVQPAVNNTHIQLCVKDFGVGIPRKKQGQVFERFYRVSGPKEITFPGLGLGLYISSEIIKRQGGKIWVESEENKGTTFCFTLPLIPKVKQQKNTKVEADLAHS